VDLHNFGVEISDHLEVPERIVIPTIANYKERGHVYDLPRSGRPPALTLVDKRKIEEEIE
jgi:hypothetical protein